MAEEKESVEAVDLDPEPAVTGPSSSVDDDLLSDFDDLLGQSPDTGGQEEPEVDLSELEAFLDDFSPGGDANNTPATPDEPDEVPVPADSADSTAVAEHPEPPTSEPEPLEPEPVSESPSTDERPQLAEDELDLSAVASAEPMKLETPDFVPSDPVVPPVAPAKPAEAPPAAATANTALPEKAKTSPLAAVLTLIALAVAGGAGYLAYEQGAQVDVLGQRLAMLEGGVGGDHGADAQARREIKRLEARLSELAIIIEGPMSHLRESNERDVRNLATRVNELEAELKAFMAAPPPGLPTASARAAAHAPPPPASGGWVVNVASLSDRPTARQEQQRLVSLGIDARLEDVAVDGKTWYRLQVAGFASKGDAQSYVDVVRRKAGLGGAWVTRD